jgi:FG-GAP-like repeat/FG-GAP repeat
MKMMILTRAGAVSSAVRSRQSLSAIVARVVAFAAVIGALVCAAERAAAQFTQQGPKLVGSGGVGYQNRQGQSVAVSADGNTAIVGGPDDNSGIGAAWVFTRSNGVWTQQGDKLVGTGAVGYAGQGGSVALSADGSTAIVGGLQDNFDVGAAWVFTRSNGVWTQQGSKLVGTGAIGPNAGQGSSVALSAEGNTAIIGGPGDNLLVGAMWVFTRSNGMWSQQGNKLVGSGWVGEPRQGKSAALSADGNTAIMGGVFDNFGAGAAWIFTRGKGVWTQQGSKLVGTGGGWSSEQGWSVSLSADGRTAIIGGPPDNMDVGAAWVFAAPPVPLRPNTHDFNGDGMSDIAWRDFRGNTAIWLMNGAAILTMGDIGAVPTSWSIVGQRDFDGDGKYDLLWRDTLGNTAIWFMNGVQVASSASVGNLPMTWSVVGTGDFNGDNLGDIIWQDTSGNLMVWLMAGATPFLTGGLGNVPLTWSIVGTGDFNGDGKTDLLWHDTLGNTSIWLMNGVQVASSASVGNIPRNWSVVGTGDFDGDGMSDIVWRDAGGNTAIWLMNGAAVSSAGGLGMIPTTWSMVLTGDYDGDGKSDLLWRDTLGNTAMWFMNGVSVSSTASIGNIPIGWAPWTVQSVNAE